MGSFLPFPIIGLGFSDGYSYPNGSLLVKQTDNRFACLTNPVKKKQSSYPVKGKFRDGFHRNLWFFSFCSVKIRFTLDYNLFLFLLLIVKIGKIVCIV